jgi:hypothetical protein
MDFNNALNLVRDQGGRRFKSSLPEHSFQSDAHRFWSSFYSGVDDFVTAKSSQIDKQRFLARFRDETGRKYQAANRFWMELKLFA